MYLRFALSVVVLFAAAAGATARHPVSKEHPRLLGSREELKDLARRNAEAYSRVVRVARSGDADDHAMMISLSLVYAIDGDEALGRQALQLAMKYVDAPIRKGHETFGHDLARTAIVYDLCHPLWTEAQRAKYHEYMNQTVDANVQSETHVFHNAWYGYKNWGYGLACYATYHENPRAAEILDTLRQDYLKRAAPALELAGAGGGFGEGYYVHYWLYEWLFFCEVARRCEGVDYYADAPSFFKNRAVASMFEMYPGMSEYGTRRPIPMGDGGGRVFGGDRDKATLSRQILVNFFRDDPAQQAVNTYNLATPRVGGGANAYKDFLWRDETVPRGDLKNFRLSHVSTGPGYVYARSSWDDDATYFFFKCGNRFTAHQHLDVGHFIIYKHAELAGDGGHYDGFGTPHDVNYHLRTIAHNILLVHDPAETWPNIRGGKVTGNDGGQTHNWRHHNGAFSDVDDWKRQYQSAHIADLVAFEDRRSYVYVAGDVTRAYSPKKLDQFTRQIVYLRPDTFVIFDRVRAKRPDFTKTWLLQAMKVPEGEAPNLVITNGKGRLFVQTLLPAQVKVRIASGDELYRYGGRSYPPQRNTGPAPECRIEISPAQPAATDYFLHVLTASDSGTNAVAKAAAEVTDAEVQLTIGDTTIRFAKKLLGGSIERNGRRVELANEVRQ